MWIVEVYTQNKELLWINEYDTLILAKTAADNQQIFHSRICNVYNSEDIQPLFKSDKAFMEVPEGCNLTSFEILPVMFTKGKLNKPFKEDK